MKARLSKWENGLAVCIFEGLADEIELCDGCSIDIKVDREQIVIRPTPAPRPTLDELVAGITNENRHDELFVE